MQTTRHDDPQVTEWLFRIVLPACAWLGLFAFFAFAGWISQHEPTRMADAVVLSVPMIDDAAAEPTRALEAAVRSAPSLPDPATAAHEELDPVGAGRSASP